MSQLTSNFLTARPCIQCHYSIKVSAKLVFLISILRIFLKSDFLSILAILDRWSLPVWQVLSVKIENGLPN